MYLVLSTNATQKMVIWDKSQISMSCSKVGNYKNTSATYLLSSFNTAAVVYEIINQPTTYTMGLKKRQNLKCLSYHMGLNKIWTLKPCCKPSYITTVLVAWVRDICGFPLFGISPAAGLLIELLEKFKNNAIANSRIGKNKSQKNCTFDLSFCSLPDGR